MGQYQFIQIACLFFKILYILYKLHIKQAAILFQHNTAACNFSAFSHFIACVIPLTDDKYSIGDIPISFLNCLEKYCTDP